MVAEVDKNSPLVSSEHEHKCGLQVGLNPLISFAWTYPLARAYLNHDRFCVKIGGFNFMLKMHEILSVERKIPSRNLGHRIYHKGSVPRYFVIYSKENSLLFSFLEELVL